MDSQAHTSPCQHKPVADNALGTVTVCPHCAVVHLAIAHVTLRFTLGAFGDLGQLVARAQASLEGPPREPAPLAPFVMPPVGRIQ